MQFTYVAFLSYAGLGTANQSQIERLRLQLDATLQAAAGRKDPVHDFRVNLKNKVGIEYEEDLARCLWASACMFLLYSPGYLESDVCCRELYIMKRLEQARFKQMEANGAVLDTEARLIFPILIRESHQALYAEEIGGKNNYCLLPKYFDGPATARSMKNRTLWESLINPLADSITNMHRLQEKYLPTDPDPDAWKAYKLPLTDDPFFQEWLTTLGPVPAEAPKPPLRQSPGKGGDQCFLTAA